LVLRAIAAHQGVRMPGFFAYLLWAALTLTPVLAIVSIAFFRA